MNGYAAYLHATADAWPWVVQLALTAIAVIACTWAAGLWLPATLWRLESGAGLPGRRSSQQGLTLAAGLATFGIAWSLAYFAAPGKPALVVAAILPPLGLVAARLHGYVPVRPDRRLLAVGVAGVVLALWMYLPNDLVTRAPAVQHRFSDLQLDLSVHALMAEMIRESGLPLRNLWATPDSAFAALTHTAHAVSMAGLAEVTGMGPYRAATLLWILATVITLWSTLELADGSVAKPSIWPVVATLAVAVWSPLSSFDPGWLVAPPALHDIVGTEGWVAGRGYWNLPQALSVAIAMAALTVLDRLDEQAGHRPIRAARLAAGAMLISSSACFKPSLLVFYGPALVLWCAYRRESARAWVALTLGLLPPLCVYALPAWWQRLPPGGAWLLDLDPAQVRAVGEYLLRALAAPLVLATALGALRRLPGPTSTLGLAAIALSGSVLFGLIFREQQFIGFDFLQPNIWWGLAGCCLLAVPLVARELPRLAAARGRPWRAALVLGLGLGALQIMHGLVNAVAYPVLVARSYPDATVRLLEKVRAMTSADTRIALDPSLDAQDLRSFVARRSLLPTSFGDAADLAAYDSWMLFASRGRGNPLPAIERLDAVVLHEQREYARALLLSLGWHAAPIEHGYSLWRRAPAAVR